VSAGVRQDRQARSVGHNFPAYGDYSLNNGRAVVVNDDAAQVSRPLGHALPAGRRAERADNGNHLK
jgi:hypothetical protein